MRIGNVFGPFEGMYWIDVSKKQLTIRLGRTGIAAEVVVSLTDEQLADTLEALMPEPVTVKPDRVRRKSGEVRTSVCVKLRGGCGETFAVTQKGGRAPVLCMGCKLKPKIMPPLIVNPARFLES